MKKKSASGHKWVYEKHGSYFFQDPRTRKWQKLCAVADGEPAMLRALAKVKSPLSNRPGSMPALIADWRAEALPKYAECTRYDYGLMLSMIEAATRDLDVAEIDSEHVLDLRDQWLDHPRSANKYQSLLSTLMQFAIIKRQRKTNPCTDVKKLPLKKRKRVLSPSELGFVIQGLLIGDDRRANASGPMMVLIVLFAYLTGLRMKDIRELTWAQVGDVITVKPTKTEQDTGVVLKIEKSPDIADLLERARALGKVNALYVFHNLKGQPYSKDGVGMAWERARTRQGIENAWFRDLRPTALSDAQEAGRSLKEIQDSAGHASITTTEDYLRGFEIKKSALGLTLPKGRRPVGLFLGGGAANEPGSVSVRR